MLRKIIVVITLLLGAGLMYSFRPTDVNNNELLHDASNAYSLLYIKRVNSLKTGLIKLQSAIRSANPNEVSERDMLKEEIHASRKLLKQTDFWLRYLEPNYYKLINGPLPVEWETEVFEKFEKPYKREGAGLTLAALALEEPQVDKTELLNLIAKAESSSDVFLSDSITKQLNNPSLFYLNNRLYLLNLAAIYTTGFECPDTNCVIPELKTMLKSTLDIYTVFNTTFPKYIINDEYLTLYNKTISFIDSQPQTFSRFDFYTFIRDYINPLFKLNQEYINKYSVRTRSYVDYTLNNNCYSIFDKNLFDRQNTKGVFSQLTDSADLKILDETGKLLFYDPLLSGNNERSCASCHKSGQFLTDTSAAAALNYNRKDFLPRNTPSLVNTVFNHLLMADGKHYTLHNQAKAVILNKDEMAMDDANEAVKKVLSCRTYRKVFNKLLSYTPQYTEVKLDHIVSAIIYYYSKFSIYYSDFDEAMNHHTTLSAEAQQGFNIFMSKAQCGTCHFVPHFNGIKPPFISSEFEVLGVPDRNNSYSTGNDSGRYHVNPAEETMYAFRTSTIRNAAYTKPYMHNGVFKTLDETIEFYNNGGGNGRGMGLSNQTLSSDSLHLSASEKKDLIAFIHSLSEHVQFELPPQKLPLSSIRKLNKRIPGGIY